MSNKPCFLPGFKTTCLITGSMLVLMSASLFLKGLRTSLAEFKVPQVLLDSAHYMDAQIWVYTHMIIIGLMILVVGWFGQGMALKIWFSRLMLAAHLVYAFMDARSSDSAIGNALYKGPASMIPVIFCLIIAALFAHTSFCPRMHKHDAMTHEL